MGGVSQWILEYMAWPIALVQDVIKWKSRRANTGLEPQRKKKSHISRTKGKLDWIFIKLCYNDHSLIGLLFLRIEVLQRFRSRKWQLVQLKSHSVMWFAEAVFLRWAGGVGSFSALAGTAYTSISALFFVGGLDPAELLSFFLREKTLRNGISKKIARQDGGLEVVTALDFSGCCKNGLCKGSSTLCKLVFYRSFH